MKVWKMVFRKPFSGKQTQPKSLAVCFCILKMFLKKFEFFLFVLNLYVFGVFRSFWCADIKFFKKKYYFNTFMNKKHFKNNHNHTLNIFVFLPNTLSNMLFIKWSLTIFIWGWLREGKFHFAKRISMMTGVM